MKNVLLPILLFMLSVQLLDAQSAERLSGEDPETTIHTADHFEANNKWDYFLYPVPAVDEVHIKITKGNLSFHQINITDEYGNDVLEMRGLSGDKMKVDVASLPEGKYFMQVVPDDKKSFVMKRFYIAR